MVMWRRGVMHRGRKDMSSLLGRLLVGCRSRHRMQVKRGGWGMLTLRLRLRLRLLLRLLLWLLLRLRRGLLLEGQVGLVELVRRLLRGGVVVLRGLSGNLARLEVRIRRSSIGDVLRCVENELLLRNRVLLLALLLGLRGVHHDLRLPSANICLRCLLRCLLLYLRHCLRVLFWLLRHNNGLEAWEGEKGGTIRVDIADKLHGHTGWDRM